MQVQCNVLPPRETQYLIPILSFSQVKVQVERFQLVQVERWGVRWK